LGVGSEFEEEVIVTSRRAKFNGTAEVDGSGDGALPVRKYYPRNEPNKEGSAT